MWTAVTLQQKISRCSLVSVSAMVSFSMMRVLWLVRVSRLVAGAEDNSVDSEVEVEGRANRAVRWCLRRSRR